MSTGKLSVAVDLSTLGGGAWFDVPFEVRRGDLSAVARSVCSRPVDLEPGTYFVTATLPGGQSLVDKVTVRAGGDMSITLAPGSDEDASGYDWQGRAKGMVEPKGGPIKRGPGDLPLVGPVILRAGAGGLLDGTLALAPPDNWVHTTDVRERVEWRVPRSAGVALVQLAQLGAPALNLALPVAPNSTCRLSATVGRGGRVLLDAQLANAEADVLLRYREHGAFQKAAQMMQSDSLSGERLLTRAEEMLMTKGMPEDRGGPIAAAVGAYTLLRMGDLDRLHDWTGNLMDWFPWLPDGAAIRAEHLAREGEHQAALAALLAMPRRGLGLPIFSEGLAHAINRLQVYASPKVRLDPAAIEQAAALLASLQRYAPFVDYAKPILTFTGLDPLKPDAVVLDAGALWAVRGEDVGAYVR